MASFSLIHLFYPHSIHLLCKMSWMLPLRRPRHVFYRHCHKILSDLNNSVPFSNIPSCDPNLTLAKHTLALPCLARRGQYELPSTAENCGNSGKVAARGQTPRGAMRPIGRFHQISTVYKREGEPELISSQYSIIFFRTCGARWSFYWSSSCCSVSFLFLQRSFPITNRY